MKLINKIGLLVAPMLFCVCAVAQPYQVNVTTNAIPPANPVISQYVSSASVNTSMLYTNPLGGSVQVLLYGKIECLSPAPFTIAVNPAYTQQGTISLTSGIPVQLASTQLLAAFGFFNDNNLVATGVNLNSIKDANNNINLPAGVYRICFSARQFDPASGLAGNFLSDPNLGCGSFTIQNTQPSNAVIINTIVIPPVGAGITQSVLNGNIKPTVQFNSAAGNSTQVKLFGKIERIAPSPFTISLNPNYTQQQPVSLNAGIPLSLTPGQVADAFGNFSDNNLVVTGIGLKDIKDDANNLKLPDGTYRLCFYARYVDPASGTLAGNASDPNLGCGTFGICASASAPQFTQPVSNFNIKAAMSMVQKISPVVFAWTPPISTCGGRMGAVTYDFEIHELLNGQTITDAINNPVIFIKQQLPSSTFLLDTLLYKDVLQSGKQYVIRVRANAATNAMVQKIDNNGYSRIEAFQYGEKVSIPNNGKPPGPPTDNNIPPDNNKPPGPPVNPPINAEGGDCGLAIPSNTSLVASNETFKNKEIKIGEFKLVPGTMTRNNDGTYKGDGTINWTPLTSVSINNVGSLGVAKLKVAFDKIKINTAYEVFDGIIVTQTDPGVFKNETFGQFKDFAKKTGTQLDKLAGDVDGFINNNPTARLISNITGNTPVDLPLGLNNQDIGGVPVTLAIMNIVFSPKGASMSILFNMNIPEANGWLTLAGSDFCIHPQGLSLTRGTLFLPIDRDFNIGSGQSAVNIKFKGCPSADSANGTYVSWENNKLTDIVAHAEMAFPQNVLAPEDNDGNIIGGSVIAKMLFRFRQWEDWVATIDLPHFQIVDVKGLSFQPSAIYYDHSVKSNASGFTYPPNAKVKKGNDFEGLYMKEFKVLLPEDFKTFNQKPGVRTDFTASNLIIDDQGLSVFIKGTNVIDISTGNLGGWGFSLDNIEVDITTNTFNSGKMDGHFLLPVSKTPLDYTGDLHLGKDSVSYAFVIKPSAKMSWDIWKASVELKPNSYIEVKKDKAGAAVTALMNGDISFIVSDGTPALKFEAITFDSLGISNRNIVTKKKEFWMSPGVWAVAGLPKKKSSAMSTHTMRGEMMTGPAVNLITPSDDETEDNNSSQGNVAGFPVSLDKLVPFVEMGTSVKAGIKLNIQMGIGGADKSIIGASTTISIFGEMDLGINSEDFRPKFKVTGGVSADSIKLFGDVGPIKVNGWLAFYKKDITFGDGIKGHVEATFPVVKIEATAQFGNVNNYNYWYIDACAQFAQPVPLVGPIGVNGFGGGAYYNMEMKNDPPKDNEMKAKTVANSSTVGSSMSGITYVPHEGTFGLKATVFACLVSGAGPKAMNAKVTLGAEINNGAFQKLYLEGDVYVFTNPPSNDRAVVKGHVDIIYNIPEEKFSLNALVLANFSAAKVTIPINLYTGPDGWFFKVGDPWGQKVSLDFPESKTAFYHYKVGATAYFVVGSLINPQLPDLPVQITNMLPGHETTDPQIQSFLTQLNSSPGSGMMFGAEVHGSLGFNVAIIYADAEALLGFDMMLKNAENLTCNNGKSAGWENWYAVGQLYAYLKLDVGLNIDVWFYSGKVSLAKFEAGAYLRGGLPNPTWMDGAVAIKGEVLGGLVKVNTNAHFSIGDKCYPDPDPLKDIKIISDAGPKGTKESVFAEPYAASNVGLNTNYEINVPPTADKPDGEVRIFQFRIKPGGFRLLKNGSSEVPSTNVEYNNDNTTVTLKRSQILDAYTNYTGEINTYAVQYVEGKGWIDPKNDKTGKYEPIGFTDKFNFRTGPLPDSIWEGNISFAYPVNKQRYVLKNEMNGKGKVHLDQAQTNILIGDGIGLNAPRKYRLYFIATGTTDTIKTDFTWDENTRDINYNIPAALKNNTSYRAEFWSFENKGMFIAAPSALKTTTSMSATNVKGIEAKTTSVVAAAIKVARPIYVMYYRTSAFNTLAEKLKAMGNWAAVKKNDNALYISNDELATEHFDEYETKGYYAPNGKTYYAPLLNVTIPWDNNQQNDRFASDNIYANAFTVNFKQVTTEFGENWVRDFRKPVSSIDLSKLYSDKPLSPSETGEPVPPSNTPKVFGGGSYAIKLPVNNVNKNQPSFSVLGYQAIVWNREKYLLADYKLMKDFASAVSWNAGAFYGWSAAYTEKYLGNLSGNVDFSYNSIGGYTGMPWNKFYYLYTDAKYMNIISSLKNLPFTSFPKGARTMQVTYKAGNMQGNTTNKIFNY